MKKTKTISFSTMLVALLTILTVLLGALFVAKPANAQSETVKAYIEVEIYDRDSEDDEYETDPNEGSVPDNLSIWARGNYGSGTLIWGIDSDATKLIIYDARAIMYESHGGFNSGESIRSQYYTVEYDSGCGTITRIEGYIFEMDHYLDSFTIPTTVTFIGAHAFTECNCEIIYEGTKASWDAITIDEAAFADSSCTIKCTDGSGVYDWDEDYEDEENNIYGRHYWKSWTPKTQEQTNTEEPGNTQDNPGSLEPEPSPTPATGIEVNIGVAIASLALVSAMFVVVRRKEER